MDFSSLQPFLQIALPIMVTFVVTVAIAATNQNKRVDDLRDTVSRRLDELSKEMTRRFDRIETKLDDHASKIAALEERTSPFRR